MMAQSKVSPVSRAVVRIDHHHAQILRLEDETSINLKEHKHQTAQHGSAVRSEHAFFGKVCDALLSFTETLVVGSHMAQADFRRYVEKHRPQLAPHLIGWAIVDHPTAPQMLAHARSTFQEFDQMQGRLHTH